MIATVSTYRAAAAHMRVIPIPNWSTPHAGTLTVTVSSPSGKTVVVEGLAIYNA